LIALKAPKLFRGDNDDFIAPMHGDMLRTFASDPSDKFAKARLGILQQPMAREADTRRSLPGRIWMGWRLFCFSGHID
jgi:hypothetical protein